MQSSNNKKTNLKGEIKPAKKQTKVLQFAKKNSGTILTENDINNLFLGFVNLIKRNVVFEKEKNYKTQISNYNKRITEYLLQLEKKNAEIESLKQQLEQSSKPSLL